MTSRGILAGALLCAIGACSAERLTQDGEAGQLRAAGDQIQWRIVGNYTPLSVNRVAADWIGNSRELLARGDISLMTRERREITELAIQSRGLSDSRLTRSQVPLELAALHLHYREVIDSYAYAANGHTRLTPLFDMTSVDQWRAYVPSDPYVPSRWFPIEAAVSGLAPPCQWHIGERTFSNDCQPIAFAATSGELRVVDASGERRQVSIEPTEVTVLAIGDAQIAGEGIGHWHDVQCHRSALSWPFLLAARLAAADPHRQFNVVSRACAGAEIRHLLDEPYAGVEQPQLTVGAKGVVVPARVRRRQLSAAAADLCGHQRDCQPLQPDYVLISAGAAELRYHQTIAAVLQRRQTEVPALDRDALDKLAADYRRLAARLRERFPEAGVLMGNYLNPLQRDGSRLCSGPLSRQPAGWWGAAMGRITGWLDRDSTPVGALQQQFVSPALRAIEQIGRQLEREYAGDWHFVANSPADRHGDAAVSGYCNGGDGVRGSWFEAVDAAAGDRRAIAANLFAQLYLAEQMHRRICAIDARFDCAAEPRQ